MMTNNRIAPATAGGRPFDHILHRPIVLIHIKVCCREVIDMVAKILGNGQGFQKNFRHDDRRADIQPDPSITRSATTEVIKRKSR